MRVGRAIWIGLLWVNGAALAGFALPALVAGLAFVLLFDDPSDPMIGVMFLAALILGFVCSWLAWSTQITRWRLWAYRRVANLDVLKSDAVVASLIWPEGHFFERTEFRSRDQAAELARLEAAWAARKTSGALPPEPSPSRLGTLGKALVFGVILMPISVLAPAGLLSFLGLDVTGQPVFLGLIVVFPLVVAVLIYRKARGDNVSADEALRRLMPRGIRRETGQD